MADTRATRALRLSCLLSLSLSFWGCAADVADEGDEGPALADVYAPLSTACAFDAKLKTVTIVIESGEQLALSKRKDGALLVNGETCGKATVSTAKVISITENASAPGDEDIVLDLSAGTFGLGSSATGAGIRMALGSGSDSIALRMGDSADRVSMGGAGIALNADAYVDVTVTSSGSTSYSVTLGKGNDTFSGQGAKAGDTPLTRPIAVYAGDGNDTLTGGNGDDQLFGGAGNDIFKGGLGDDLCSGDAGDDIYDESRPAGGTNGNDTYTDSAGTKDKLDYSTRGSALVIDMEPAASDSNDDGELAVGEADQVDPGIDILLGGSGDDQLAGDANANTIFGGAGDDILAGGGGADTLSGDTGNDRFDEGDGPNGADVFKGGAGIDTIDYGARTGRVAISLDGRFADDGDIATNESDKIQGDIENCVGGAGADDITGSAVNNVIAGGGGADVLRGGAGNDRFDEGDGENGGDTFIGGVGIDTVDYSARSQPLTVTMESGADDGEDNEHDSFSSDIEGCIGGTGSDTLIGSARGDDLFGGDGDDIVRGGPGDDTLSGEAGDDTLYGEAGNDTLDGGEELSQDTLDCGTGEDVGFNGESAALCEL